MIVGLTKKIFKGEGCKLADGSLGINQIRFWYSNTKNYGSKASFIYAEFIQSGGNVVIKNKGNIQMLFGDAKALVKKIFKAL